MGALLFAKKVMGRSEIDSRYGINIASVLKIVTVFEAAAKI